jgi:hypothetical protein
MDKQSLFHLLLDTIHRADLSQFLEFSAAHSELTSQFNLSELVKLDDSLKKCLGKQQNSEWVTYLVYTNLYKKGDIKMFFDEISLATVHVPGEVRLMLPDGMQRHTKGMPDCIAVTMDTGEMQGLEFKHLKTDRTVLQEFLCRKYDIVTPNEFKLHYQNQPYVNKVYSYSEIQKRMPGYSRFYFDQQTMYSMKARNMMFSDFHCKWFGFKKF